MAIEDILSAATVRPVTVGFLDFRSDPIYGWDGPGAFAPSGTGDSDLDGNTFLSVEGAVDITEFGEDTGLGKPISISFAGGEFDDEVVFEQLVVDQRLFMGRRAKFWRFFMDADEASVQADFDTLFNGVMVGAELSRQPGSPAIITVHCDSDLSKARFTPARWADHQFYNSGDTATTFLNSLSRGGVSSAEQVPGRPPVPPPGRPGRGGRLRV